MREAPLTTIISGLNDVAYLNLPQVQQDHSVDKYHDWQVSLEIESVPFGPIGLLALKIIFLFGIAFSPIMFLSNIA